MWSTFICGFRGGNRHGRHPPPRFWGWTPFSLRIPCSSFWKQRGFRLGVRRDGGACLRFGKGHCREHHWAGSPACFLLGRVSLLQQHKGALFVGDPLVLQVGIICLADLEVSSAFEAKVSSRLKYVQTKTSLGFGFPLGRKFGKVGFPWQSLGSGFPFFVGLWVSPGRVGPSEELRPDQPRARSEVGAVRDTFQGSLRCFSLHIPGPPVSGFCFFWGGGSFAMHNSAKLCLFFTTNKSGNPLGV